MSQPGPEPALTSSDALRMFRGLIAEWRMPPARAWRMLTGVGYQAGALSVEQIHRVEILALLDLAMRGIAAVPVGEWMVTPNGAPLFAGSSPADSLSN